MTVVYIVFMVILLFFACLSVEAHNKEQRLKDTKRNYESAIRILSEHCAEPILKEMADRVLTDDNYNPQYDGELEYQLTTIED